MSAPDAIIWKILDKGSCSYRVRNKTNNENFCMNKFNVDGLCKLIWCPLANSEYATVVEEEGRVSLKMRTVERNHLPSQWWEDVQLDPNDVEKSRAIILDKLEFHKGRLRGRCIDRFTKLCQVLKRIREVRMDQRVSLEQVHKKRERKLNRREKKALVAANLEPTIEKELLKRLNRGVYGEMYKELLEDEESEEEEEEDRDVRFEDEEEEDEEEELRLKEKESMPKFVADEKTEFENLNFDLGFDHDIEDIINQYNKRERRRDDYVEGPHSMKRRKVDHLEREVEEEEEEEEEEELEAMVE